MSDKPRIVVARSPAWVKRLQEAKAKAAAWPVIVDHTRPSEPVDREALAAGADRIWQSLVAATKK